MCGLEIISPIQLVALSLCWSFILLCRRFLVWWSPLFIFVLLLFLWENSQTIVLRLRPKRVLPMFSSKISMVLSLTFKFLIPLFLYTIWGGIPVWFFCIELSNFLNSTYWRVSLPHWILLPPIGMWVHFWTLYSVLWIYFCTNTVLFYYYRFSIIL